MTVCATTGPYAYDPNVQVLWVASVVNVQAPTAAEVATGVDLEVTYDLTDIIGWEISTNKLQGAWGPFERQRMGKQKIGDSSLGFAAFRNGADIRSLLDRGDDGYVIILPSGPYLEQTAAPVNVYPVTVAQLSQLQRLGTGGGSKILVDFVITERCGENVTVVGP